MKREKGNKGSSSKGKKEGDNICLSVITASVAFNYAYPIRFCLFVRASANPCANIGFAGHVYIHAFQAYGYIAGKRG